MDLEEICKKAKLFLAAICKTIGVSDSAAANMESCWTKTKAKIIEACKKACDEGLEPEGKSAGPVEKITQPAEKDARPAVVKMESVEEKTAPAEVKEAPVNEKAAPAEEKAEPVKKTKPAERKAKPEDVKAEPADGKAEPAVKKAKPAENKTRPAAGKTGKNIKKEAPAAEKEMPIPCEVIIQSPVGSEITPEAILAKLGDVDKVYVRVDENKAYWVKGEQFGDIDLW